jgi:hypothetical protein
MAKKFCYEHNFHYAKQGPCPFCKPKYAGLWSAIHDLREASEQVGYCSCLDDDDPIRIEAWGIQADTYLKIKEILNG